MLGEFKNKLIKKRIESLLRKYGIQVKHSLPGRIRLGFPGWKEREEKVLRLIEEMKLDPDIASIEFTKETGSALIYFNQNSDNQSNSFNRWLSIIEKYL
ncbi:hypothetical protein P9265_06275 [Schinkia azotoformans]|uniref:HMA2 domain-containing protein n=1 Tax=Schinkia azotoformans TaxID=1454 RepID=UPI002E1EB66E|nr:hypothetical protein [Schinkia azotoformans]